MAAGFYPRRQSTICVPLQDGSRELDKQCSYVRCIVQLVCRCAALERERNVNALSLVINNLLTELEAVAANSQSPHALVYSLTYPPEQSLFAVDEPV